MEWCIRISFTMTMHGTSQGRAQSTHINSYDYNLLGSTVTEGKTEENETSWATSDKCNPRPGAYKPISQTNMPSCIEKESDSNEYILWLE